MSDYKITFKTAGGQDYTTVKSVSPVCNWFGCDEKVWFDKLCFGCWNKAKDRVRLKHGRIQDVVAHFNYPAKDGKTH